MTVCSALNAVVLGFASTLYLVLGLAIIAASAATFFTPYGKIFTTIYAVSGLGAGVIIFLVSIVGYLAACSHTDRKKGRCWLGLYMLFDLIIIVLIIVAVILMFRYEDVLELASKANLDGNVKSGLAALSDFETNIVEDVVTNAFDACNGTTVVKDAPLNVELEGSAAIYDFSCSESAFATLGTTVDVCVSSGVNATLGSSMYICYTTSTSWYSNATLDMYPTVGNVLNVLQTPKGLYCACAATITNDFILRYITIVKWVGIGVAVFFILIFVSCCYLCCCGPKRDDEEGSAIQFTAPGSYAASQSSNPNFQPGGWSAGSGAASSKQKYKSGKYGGQDGAFVARP